MTHIPISGTESIIRQTQLIPSLLAPLLLSWIDFNPNMDKQSYAQ